MLLPGFAPARAHGTVALDRKTKTWLITTEPHVMTRLKRIFPRVSPSAQGTAPLADNAANGVELLWFLERFPHEMRADDRAYLEARAGQHRERQTIVEQVLAAGYAPPTFQMLKPARGYQALAIDLNLKSGALLIADDLGLGKTVQGIGLLSDPRTLPALIVCPTHLPTHWERKIAEFLGERVLVHLLDKGTPYDLVKRCGRVPDVIISNYHKLSGWAQTLAECGIKTVIADEAQHFRHPGTQKYEAMLYLRDRTEFRCFLSATPIFNYGGEIHAVMTALRDDCLGLHEEFTREWCGGFGGPKAKVEDTAALNAHLVREGLMVRRRRAEVGRELPALTNVVQVVDVGEGAALAAEEASIAELAEVLLADGGTGIDKMQAARDVDLKLRQATGIDKAPFAAKFIRMLVAEGQQVVAFAWHRRVYEILLELLGPGQLEDGEELEDLRPLLFTGSETARKKDEAREKFISGECRVLLMSLRSGEGVDGLQDVCSTTVHVELDWSPQVHGQNIGRVHRDGQTKPVFAYTLVSEEGSDPVIADVLGVKAGQFEGLFNPSATLVEATQATPDRVKQLAASYLATRRAKKAAGPRPGATAPSAAALRPVVTAQPVKPVTPPPPPRPAPDRYVRLRGPELGPDQEKMLLTAGVGVTPSDILRIKSRAYQARVGFAGARIVAVQIDRV